MDTEVSVAATRLSSPHCISLGKLYLRRTIEKLNTDSEVKFCIGVGAVRRSGHNYFKI